MIPDSLPPDWPINFSDPKLPTPSLSLVEPKDAPIRHYMNYLFYEKEQPPHASNEILTQFRNAFEDQTSPNSPSTDTSGSHRTLADDFEETGSRFSSPDITIVGAYESPVGVWSDLAQLEIEQKALPEGAPYALAYFLEQALQHDKGSFFLRSSLSFIFENCPSHPEGYPRENQTNDACPRPVEVDGLVNEIYHTHQQFIVANQQLVKKPLELFRQNTCQIELQIMTPWKLLSHCETTRPAKVIRDTIESSLRNIWVSDMNEVTLDYTVLKWRDAFEVFADEINEGYKKAAKALKKSMAEIHREIWAMLLALLADLEARYDYDYQRTIQIQCVRKLVAGLKKALKGYTEYDNECRILGFILDALKIYLAERPHLEFRTPPFQQRLAFNHQGYTVFCVSTSLLLRNLLMLLVSMW
jgi:hypothetical protein